jgi:hypothetical protein
MERLRFVGNINKPMLYAQYLTLMCAIPVLRMFHSDIMVCAFRKS